MLKKVFNLLDIDKSGFLRFSEVIMISSEPQTIMDFYAKSDKNKDQKITFDEYKECFGKDTKAPGKLYEWLIKNNQTIEKIKSKWISTCEQTEKGTYSLETPMYIEESYRVLQHLNLDHKELSNLHKFLEQQKLFKHVYVHYGELMSLVCYYFTFHEA